MLHRLEENAGKYMKFEIKKPTWKQVRKFIYYILMVLAGNAIAAAASTLFIIPNGFVMGGTTGLGIFVRNLVDDQNEWLVSFTVYGVNIGLFLIGAFLLGKKFAFATLAGTLLYPSFVSLFTYINELYVASHGQPIAADDPWLAIICGSFMFGIGIGCAVRVGASTGGTDIPPLILHKFFNIPVALSLWVLDLTIVLIQMVAVPLDTVLYGFVITLLSSVVLDLVSPIGQRKRQVQIVSSKWKEIRTMILNDMHRGITLLHARTGFLQEERYVIMTVVSNRELVRLRNSVQAIDPEAFFTVCVVSEVRGRGFSSEKIWLPLSEERDVSDFPVNAGSNLPVKLDAQVIEPAPQNLEETKESESSSKS